MYKIEKNFNSMDVLKLGGLLRVGLLRDATFTPLDVIVAF